MRANGLSDPIKSKAAGPAPELAAALGRCKAAFVGVASFSALINLLVLTGPIFMLQILRRDPAEPERTDARSASPSLWLRSTPSRPCLRRPGEGYWSALAPVWMSYSRIVSMARWYACR